MEPKIVSQAVAQTRKVELTTQNRLLLDNVVGIFETDSKGKPLYVKQFGNGAMVPFSKKYLFKKIFFLFFY